MSIVHARHAAALLLTVTGTALPNRSAAQENDRYRELARRVVSTSAAVKPGEVVFVVGGKHVLPLMEAVAMEVTRAGAIPISTLESERVISTFFHDMPEQHLRRYDSAGTKAYGDQLRSADAMIYLPLFTNPDSLFQTFAADTARMAKVMHTFAESQRRYDEMRNTARTRFVFLNYPPSNKTIAESGMDSTSFDRMVWDAMTTDYDRIAAQGRAIKRLLDGGKMVRVTTPDGTDLQLRLTGRSAAMTGATVSAEQRKAKLAGQRSVTLPGGRVAVAPLESSGSGKVVIARDKCFGAPLVNARFELRAGKLTGFEADSGATCVTNFLGSAPGPDDMVGALSIGLNPALKPTENSAGFRPWEASGAVVLQFGNNTDLGGRNNTPSAFAFWLSQATVEIDGKVVVKDGQLAADVAQGR